MVHVLRSLKSEDLLQKALQSLSTPLKAEIVMLLFEKNGNGIAHTGARTAKAA